MSFCIFNPLFTQHKTTTENCFQAVYEQYEAVFSGGVECPLVVTNGNTAFIVLRVKMHYCFMRLSAHCSYIGS